jgi:hypothetical protein
VHNPLGDFLRARRDRGTPDAAGLHVVVPRRVPGLRRDEVVDALARALQLDGDAHRHPT